MTSVMVGEHGSNLVGELFLHPAATVVEFFPTSAPTYTNYMHLAHLGGHPYFFVRANATNYYDLDLAVAVL